MLDRGRGVDLNGAGAARGADTCAGEARGRWIVESTGKIPCQRVSSSTTGIMPGRQRVPRKQG